VEAYLSFPYASELLLAFLPPTNMIGLWKPPVFLCVCVCVYTVHKQWDIQRNFEVDETGFSWKTTGAWMCDW